MKSDRFFYGWTIVAVSFVNMAAVFGVWYSFSVFFVAVLREFGWSRADTAGVFSCFMLVHSLSAVVIGGYLDRFGPRIVFPAATCIIALGLLLTSRIQALWEFYLWYGVLTSVGVCAIGFIAHGIILPKWFNRKRGLALGISMAGVGVGMQLLVPATQLAISSLGWRSAYCILAGIIVLVLFPLNALFQRKDPKEIGEVPDGAATERAMRARPDTAQSAPPEPIARTLAEAARTRPFWLLSLTFFFTPLAVQATLIHQVAGVIDRGFSAAEAAFVFGLAGILGSAGKILFGFLSDRIGRERAFALGLGCAFFGVICLLLLQPGQTSLLYGYAILFGLGYGSLSAIFPARAADLFLGPDFGTIVGILSLAGGVGGALGVWASGKIFDVTASYSMALGMALVAMALSITLFWLAGTRKPA